MALKTWWSDIGGRRDGKLIYFLAILYEYDENIFPRHIKVPDSVVVSLFPSLSRLFVEIL